MGRGGSARYAGGGAGGVAIGYIPVTPSPGAYSISIGGGGAGGPWPYAGVAGFGNPGSNTTFSNPNITTITAVGGAGGLVADTSPEGNPGGSGAGYSGDGNGYGFRGGGQATQPAQNPGNPLVTNYGNPGGGGRSQPGANSGGGGGGAGEAGKGNWPGGNSMGQGHEEKRPAVLEAKARLPGFVGQLAAEGGGWEPVLVGEGHLS